MSRPFIATALLAVIVLVSPRCVEAAPLDAYGRLPAIEDAALSPDGGKLAVIGTNGEARKIIIRDLKTGATKVIGAGSIKVRSLMWAGSDTILFTTSTTTMIPGVEAPRAEYWQLYQYALKADRVRPLMNDVGDGLNVINDMPMVRIVDGEPAVFVEGIKFVESRGRVALFRIDLDTGRSRLVNQGLWFTKDWLVGADGEVLAEADHDTNEGRWTLRVRDPGGLRTLLTLDDAAISAPEIVGLGRTPGTFLVLAETNGRGAALYELSATSTSLGEAIWTGALDQLIFDPQTGALAGFEVLEGDWQRSVFLSAEDQKRWTKIEQAYKGALLHLASWSADRTRLLVALDSPEEGPGYALIDTQANTADAIGWLYEDVPPEEIAPKRAMSFKAADGLSLTGYLTLPLGRPEKGLPLVALVHGGPAARDRPGFDWWAQALASCGYAVLQVNYRGSDGFGGEFVRAGYGQWGGKMQTDVSDAVRQLVAAGVVDPRRVCIVGASYGGYAALAGAVFEPDVYRCAVSVAGPADLPEMVLSAGRSRGVTALRYWRRFMGAEEGQEAKLRAISPAFHVDQVRAPILLIHGRDDTVVPFYQSAAMDKALRAAGKSSELVTLEGEDHWLSRGATRQQMLAAVVAFLEKQNPPN